MSKLPWTAVAFLCCTTAAAETKKASESFEVTARLVRIPGKFPPDELYDYAYVMQYRVQGGMLDGKLLLVAHYKPRQPRDKIRDKMRRHVSGTLRRFAEGEVHRMTLTHGIKQVWRGAVVDEFFATDRKSPRYFCLKVDPAKEK